MNRRQFLAASGATALAQTPAKPNVVVVLSDDQGFGDLGANGAPDIQTPHLDRIASEGVRFTNWHSNSPVCSPSRASVMTGRYPQMAGIPEILFSRPNFDVAGLRSGEVTLANEFKKLGYRTAAVGKWHLGSTPESRPRAQGFDEFFGFYSGWIDYYSHRYYQLGGQPVFHDLWRNETEVWEEPAYQTELLAREAKAFVQRQSGPFLLYLTFGAPHYPMMAPKKYLDRFPASMDRDRRLHAAMIAAVDDAVGEVASAAPRDTIFYFQADNGATSEVRADHRARPYRGGSNGRNRGWKGSLYEGGHNVPALLRAPGRVPPGQVSNALGLGMDVLPTLLGLAGAKAPNGIDGADLSPVLARRAAPPPERTVFWDYKGQGAARRRNWKLVVDPMEELGGAPTKGQFLYDLAEDPRESTDRSAAAPEVARTLRAGLDAWRASFPNGK